MQLQQTQQAQQIIRPAPQQHLQPTPVTGEGLGEVEMFIPNMHVGLVIGRGGEMIRTLQDRSQGRIQVQPDRERDMSSDKRRITLSGTAAAKSEARRLIEEVVRLADTEGSAAGAMQQAAGPLQAVRGRARTHWPPPSTDFLVTPQGQVEKKIMVPSTAVGIIIGKAGQTIQMLQQQVLPF